MKKFSILLVLFFITSCAAAIDEFFPKFPESNDFINRFGQNKKGIIIFKLSSKFPATTWCKSSLEKELLKANCFDIKPSKNYQILMLEPGWYEIRGFEKSAKRYGKGVINPKFSNSTEKRISKPKLAFQVLQDKISFVGKINYQPLILSNSTSQKEDFNEIQSSLKNENIKKLHKIFAGHKFESEILAKKFEDKIFVKNLVKESEDFVKIRKGAIKAK